MAEHRINVVGNSAEAWVEAGKLLDTARKRGMFCEVTVRPVFVSPDGAGKYMRMLHGVFVITGETGNQDAELSRRLPGSPHAAEAAA
jgi:hypothetical protein